MIYQFVVIYGVCALNEKENQAIDCVLFDYKRVLQENEELKTEYQKEQVLEGVLSEKNIEEDIQKVNKYLELVLEKDYCDCNELNVIVGRHCDGSKNVAYAINSILSYHKRVLEENEELKSKNKTLEELLQGSLYELYKYYKELASTYQGSCIPVQKVKDKIKEINKIYDDIPDNEGNFTKAILIKEKQVLQELITESEE